MKYNFEEVVDRKNTNAIKWEKYEKDESLKDCVPLWIADMDIPVCKEVVDAIVARAKHPVYGYTSAKEELYELIVEWYKKRNNASILKEEIILSTGVVHSYFHMIQKLLKEDEKIIIMTPVYPPFYHVPENMNREFVCCPLIQEGLEYRIDYDLFEKMLSEDPKIKLFNLCNPHNPLGIDFSLEELNKMCEICHRYGVYILSDEIHSDLIMPGYRHNTALNIKDEYKDKLIVTASPTKTFNIAGLKISYLIVPNKELREELNQQFSTSGCSDINLFGLEATVAAYKNAEEWLDELLEHIQNNFNFLKDYLNKNLPKVKFKMPTSTYLAWLDLTEYDLPQDFQERLMKEGNVEFNPGINFKGEYRHLRINVACPRSQLEKGLDNLKTWLEKNNE